MSKWTKEELENMLEDVVNELDLSDSMIEKHGPHGTAPAELVRLVLAQKNLEIRALESGMRVIRAAPQPDTVEPVAWMHDERVDVIHDSVKKLLGDYQESPSYLHRKLDRTQHYTIPLYTHPPAKPDTVAVDERGKEAPHE